MDTILEPNVVQMLKDSFEDGLTQSEIMTRMNCPRKWYFRYIQQIKKQGTFSWALVFGDAVHQMLETYYTIANTLEPGGSPSLTQVEVPDFRFEEDVMLRPDQADDHEYYRGLARILVDHHNKYWREFDEKMIIEATEQEVELRHRGFRLRGKIDLVIRPNKGDGLFAMDHKTTSDFSEGLFAGWSFRFQFLFYAWLQWKITGVYPAGMYVNAIKKPKERRSIRNQETVAQFLKRIRLNIATDPSLYFKRERLPFDKSTLPRFERYTLDPILVQYEMIHGATEMSAEEFEDWELNSTLESLLLSMNTDHCHTYNRPCEFLDLCQNNLEDHAQEYINMQHKHPELQK